MQAAIETETEREREREREKGKQTDYWILRRLKTTMKKKTTFQVC